MEATAASFAAVLEPVDTVLRTTAADPPVLEGVRIAQWPARFAAARAFARTTPYRLDDVSSVASPSCPLAQSSRAACALYLPLLVGERAAGVLAAGWTLAPAAPLAAEHQRTLASFAERAASSL